MLRSMNAAISGLRNQQTKMDVIGNNISNVNTVAFKSSRVTFKESFAQIVRSASRPTEGAGGLNPMAVGLGAAVGSMDTMFTQGNLETTGRNTDLAIQGTSFFVVKNGTNTNFTRSGNFQLDANGTLVSGNNGMAVQGRMAVAGKFNDSVSDITISMLQTSPANPTSKVTMSGNLDASAQVFDQGSAATLDALDPDQRAIPANKGAFKDVSITVYDSLGTQHELKAVFWKTGANEWDWKIDDSSLDIAGNVTEAGTHPITFAPDGSVDTDATPDVPEITFTPNSGASDVTLKLDLGTGMNGLTQFGGSSNAVMREQDGYTNGTLQAFNIDATGTIVGGFTNGTTQVLGQIELADFNNPEGLSRVGNNMYAVTANSGSAVLGYAGEGVASSIASGALEMSNVDLAQEFTNMIVAQRSFQANGRVISTTDQLLQELVELKR
jgi:flagellar hook protein FlgE